MYNLNIKKNDESIYNYIDNFNFIIDKKKYLIDLFNKYNNSKNKKLICTNYLNAILNFIPLPINFLKNNLNINNNYEFENIVSSNIIIADKLIPSYNFLIIQNINYNYIDFPIPFTFPIHYDNYIELVQSNIYYYEVTINDFMDNDLSKLIIGFGSTKNLISSQLGFKNSAFCYYTKEGGIYVHNKLIFICDKIDVGNTIGCGLIYLSVNEIKSFFTLNGKLVFILQDQIIIDNNIFPLIEFNNDLKININLCNDKFSFDIKTMIYNYSNISISTNNSFIKNFEINKYQNKIPSKISNIIFLSPSPNNTDFEYVNNITNSNINNIGIIFNS